MKTNVEQLKEKLRVLLEDASATFELMDELKEWDTLGEIIANFKALADFVNRVVVAVELAANDLADDLEDLKEEEKVKAAAEVIDDYLDFPWYLEKVDGPTFEMLIALAMDWIGDRVGDDWTLDAARDALADSSQAIKEALDY